MTLLLEGDIELKGRMPWSSNHTFLVEVSHRTSRTFAVYKPGRGERPLWDFPAGLYRRERAAYVLSEALGWQIVPETVIREGPLGEGSLQRLVEADPEDHYFTLLEDPNHADALRTIATFDVLANNADRKGGHFLLGEGQIWAIDNGLCFHADRKLRTVVWDFAGERISDRLLADVARVAASPPPELDSLLSAPEHAALVRRARQTLARPEFPLPDGARAYPWPMV